MRLSHVLLSVLAVLPSMAAAEGEIAVTLGTGTPWTFRCPTAGTRVTYSDGSTLTAGGADAASPLICRVGGATGEQRLVFGLFTAEGEIGARFLEAAQRLAAGRAGTMVAFSVPGPAGLGPVRHEWRIGPARSVELPAGAFRAVTLERQVRPRLASGGEGLGLFADSIDIASGVVLQRRSEIAEGDQRTQGLTVEVVRVEAAR